jgi:hypothetical protein
MITYQETMELRATLAYYFAQDCGIGIWASPFTLKIGSAFPKPTRLTNSVGSEEQRVHSNSPVHRLMCPSGQVSSVQSLRRKVPAGASSGPMFFF